MYAKHQLSFAVIVIIACTMLPIAELAPGSQRFECTKALDCAPGECCVIGMMRYSFPSCLHYGKEGDYCLGNSQPRNVTLYYPNGLAMDLSEVHTLFCPCDATMALSCRQGTCQSRIDIDTSNVI